MKHIRLFSVAIVITLFTGCTVQKVSQEENRIINIIHQVNDYWQSSHPAQQKAFWDNDE